MLEIGPINKNMTHTVVTRDGKKKYAEVIYVRPYEKAPCVLPNRGRTSQDSIQLIIDKEWSNSPLDINYTGETIRVFHIEDFYTGLDNGYVWEVHLELDSLERV